MNNPALMELADLLDSGCCMTAGEVAARLRTAAAEGGDSMAAELADMQASWAENESALGRVLAVIEGMEQRGYDIPTAKALRLAVVGEVGESSVTRRPPAHRLRRWAGWGEVSVAAGLQELLPEHQSQRSPQHVSVRGRHVG